MTEIARASVALYMIHVACGLPMVLRFVVGGYVDRAFARLRAGRDATRAAPR